MDYKNAMPLPAHLNSDGSRVVILDQTLLPNREEFLELDSIEPMYEAIKKLRVRGAPAIGIFAACAMAVLAGNMAGCTPRPAYDDFLDFMASCAERLNDARPTAINLRWALERQMNIICQNNGRAIEDIAGLMRIEAQKILDEDIAMCHAMAESGIALLKEGCGILTHCNAGALATSRYGTALGPIYLAQERGLAPRVFADETRPLLQGARLTSYELSKAGVDVTLICDSMAASIMKEGLVDICLVGCDRVAANGDVANKIGTLHVAVAARHFGIPFYVIGPTSSIDINCRCGSDIPIEERDQEEIRSMFYESPKAPAEVKCRNPAFDVTDAALISGIITEKGILRPPYEEAIRNVVVQKDGCFSL